MPDDASRPAGRAAPRTDRVGEPAPWPPRTDCSAQDYHRAAAACLVGRSGGTGRCAIETRSSRPEKSNAPVLRRL
eukprot:5921268-Pyramimonas_sp.AAC.1